MCGSEGSCITVKSHYVDTVEGTKVARLEVTNAPQLCKISLEVLVGGVGMRVDGCELRIGYPAADEVCYRILRRVDYRGPSVALWLAKV